MLRRIATLVLLVGCLLGLSACGSDANSDPAALEGVEWGLASMSGSTADVGAVGITATFDGRRIGGFSGVNQYGGEYTAEKSGAFSVGELAGTLMAGPEPLMKAESAYLKALEGCDAFEVSGDSLTLSTDGERTLVFRHATAAELPGTKWVVTGYNNGKQAVTSVALDSTMTVEFGTDGDISGSAGVNTYTGSFTSTEATVEIGPLVATKLPGPEALMAQETAFLAALENSTVWSISRSQLEMRDARGAIQVTGLGE